jgi:hypothetical protein
VGAIMLLLGCGLIVSLTMNQPISISRYFIFTTPLLLVVLVASAMMVIDLTVHPRRRYVLFVLFALFTVGNVCHTMKANHEKSEGYQNAVLPFAIGRLTYKDYYEKHGIFSPDALTARRYAGLEERIISSNPMHQSYAIPGRPMEVEMNYSYRNWHTMVFDDPVIARMAFEGEGIKYFYFDFTYPVNGMIPFSPLFQARGILPHLRVVWYSQNAYLLTWRHSYDMDEKTPGECLWWGNPRGCVLTWRRGYFADKDTSVEAEFAGRLAENVSQNSAGRNLYERVKLYWLRNGKAASPVKRDRSLPEVQGLY